MNVCDILKKAELVNEYPVENWIANPDNPRKGIFGKLDTGSLHDSGVSVYTPTVACDNPKTLKEAGFENPKGVKMALGLKGHRRVQYTMELAEKTIPTLVIHDYIEPRVVQEFLNDHNSEESLTTKLELWNAFCNWDKFGLTDRQMVKKLLPILVATGKPFGAKRKAVTDKFLDDLGFENLAQLNTKQREKLEEQVVDVAFIQYKQQIQVLKGLASLPEDLRAGSLARYCGDREAEGLEQNQVKALYGEFSDMKKRFKEVFGKDEVDLKGLLASLTDEKSSLADSKTTEHQKLQNAINVVQGAIKSKATVAKISPDCYPEVLRNRYNDMMTATKAKSEKDTIKHRSNTEIEQFEDALDKNEDSDYIRGIRAGIDWMVCKIDNIEAISRGTK